MKTSHTYCILYCGAVLLLLGYVGVCVLAEERTPLELRAAGSSFILPLGYPTDSVSFAQWTYNTKSFAIYRNKKLSITNELQFSGRLKVNSDDLSVEVMNLQLSDSGSYVTVAQSYSGEQLPTETIILTVYGVCVLAEERTPSECRAAGSSLILPLGYPTDSVVFAQWRYSSKSFAIYRNKKISVTKELQFSGRLKVNSDDLSVEVMNLQLSDSGSYTIVAQSSSGEQHPVKTIILTVYDVIKVEIEIKQTWKAATNSCDVHLLCRAPEGQTVSYRWRGFKEEDGSQLNFTLTSEDGDVTLNCTAVSSTGSGSKTTTVKCTPEEIPTDLLFTPGAPFSVLHLLSFLMAASPYLLSTIILGVKNYRA